MVLVMFLMTISLYLSSNSQLEKWCRRKELNLVSEFVALCPDPLDDACKLVGEGRIELPPLVPRTRMPAITLLPELLVLPRRIELRSLVFRTSVITRLRKQQNFGGPRGLCPHRLSDANRVLF
jgi:hypothetical protein